MQHRGKSEPVRDAVASRIDASFEHINASCYENIVFIARVGTRGDSMLDFLARATKANFQAEALP